MTTLGVPFNGIARPHTNPLRQRPILSLCLGKLDFCAKGFDRWLKKKHLLIK
jgi:hypothetical protein